MLSMKDEYTFLFLIIGLCNSFANFLLDMISFLIALPKADLPASEVGFLSKTL